MAYELSAYTQGWPAWNTSASALTRYQNYLDGRKPDLAIDFNRETTWSNAAGQAYYLVQYWANKNPDKAAQGYTNLVFGLGMLPSADPSKPTMELGAAGCYTQPGGTVTAGTTRGGVAYSVTSVGGMMDDQLNNIVNTFPNAVLRVGWEFNGNWYAWGQNNPYGTWTTAADFIAYFRLIYTLAKSKSAGLQVCWNPDLSNVSPNFPENLYPGDGYVDIIGLDSYDQWYGSTPTSPGDRWAKQTNEAWGYQEFMNFLGLHRTNPTTGLPIKAAFPEWGAGLNAGCVGDSPVWMQRMLDQHDWLDALDRLALSCYWDDNDPGTPPLAAISPANAAAEAAYGAPYAYNNPLQSSLYKAKFGAVAQAAVPTRSTGRPTAIQSVMASGLSAQLPNPTTVGNKLIAVVFADTNTGGLTLPGIAGWKVMPATPTSLPRGITVLSKTIGRSDVNSALFTAGASFASTIFLMEVANCHSINADLGLATAAAGGLNVATNLPANTLALALMEFNAQSDITVSQSPAPAGLVASKTVKSGSTFYGAAVVDITNTSEAITLSGVSLTTPSYALLLLNGNSAPQATTAPAPVQAKFGSGGTVSLDTAPAVGNTLVALCSAYNPASPNSLLTMPVGWHPVANACDGMPGTTFGAATLHVSDPNMKSVTFGGGTGFSGQVTLLEYPGFVDVKCVHGLPMGGPANNGSASSIGLPVPVRPALSHVLGMTHWDSGNSAPTLTNITSAGGTVYGATGHSGHFSIPAGLDGTIVSIPGGTVYDAACAIVTVTPA